MTLLLLYDISPALTFSNSTSSHNSIIQLIFAIWQLLYVRTVCILDKRFIYVYRSITNSMSCCSPLRWLLLSKCYLYILEASQLKMLERKDVACSMTRGAFFNFVDHFHLVVWVKEQNACHFSPCTCAHRSSGKSVLFVSPASIKKRYQKYHSIYVPL